MSENRPVIIRGHTLLCLQGFRGEGYSPDFVANMRAIHEELAQHPERSVQVVDGPDAVCGACPHHQAVTGCTLSGDDSETEMHRQDEDVLGRLGLQSGMKLTWAEVLQRIRERVSGDDLPAICGQCRWLPLGYCREGIERLKGRK